MPQSLPFITLDVFTTTPYKGNPLAAVFLPSPDSDPASAPITQPQKQTIAREFNLSETIFIHPSNEDPDHPASRTIDIFTVSSEIPFAGHPTIGAASWFLRHSPDANPHAGPVRSLRMKAGEVPIALYHHPQPRPQPPESGSGSGAGSGCGCGSENANANAPVTARIAHNVHLHSTRFPTAELLNLHPSLGVYIPTTNGAGSHPLFSIVKGMNQLLVELPSLEALAAVTTASGGREISNAFLDEGWREGMVATYFFARGERGDGSVIRSRMVLGDLEDPATGSAACGLAVFLALLEGRDGVFGFEVVQGVEMGRRSEIGVEVCVGGGGGVESVVLMGSAVMVSEGRIVVPEV